MFRHGRVEVPISVGVSIDPKTLKNGMVVGKDAVHVNKLIGDIRRDLQQAYDILVEEAKIPITKLMVRVEYDLVRTTRLADEAMSRFTSAADQFVKKEKSKLAVMSLEYLQLQIEEEEKKLAEKKAR